MGPNPRRVDDRDYCGNCGRQIADLESGRRGLCRDCAKRTDARR